MPCKDCFNGCLETVSDKCVSSTIPEHEGSLFDVLTGVLEDLKKSLEGKNIKIDLEDFPEILHPTEKRDVESLINVIFSYLEKFKKDIDDLQPAPVSF